MAQNGQTDRSNPSKVLDLRLYYQIGIKMQQEFLEVKAELTFEVKAKVKVEKSLLKRVILSGEIQLNKEPILFDDGRRIS